jgi:aspartate aminotransferase
MKIADRMEKLGTETAFRVLAQVSAFSEARRKRVISFAIGEPDFNTPEHIKEAAIQSLRNNNTHYVPSAGIRELREACAEYAGKLRDIEITPEMITILPSAKQVISLAVLTCMDPGDRVIYPNPGYPIYESQIKVFDGIAVPAQLKEENDFNYDIDELRRLIIPGKTKMIVLNSPQNPTGSVLSKSNLEAIAELAIQHDLWILSDEIYANFTYDGKKHYSIASLDGMQERTIILDGFSKFWAMTGWRLGFSVTNPKIASHFANWATNTISCTAPFVQHGGLAALKQDFAPSWAMVQEFENRRNLICDLLNNIKGLSVKRPRGAFYLFCNVTKACENLGLKNALEFQQYLLDKADVVVLARSFFGERDPDETQEYVRFSYCVSRDNIVEGCKRIKEAVEQK